MPTINHQCKRRSPTINHQYKQKPSTMNHQCKRRPSPSFVSPPARGFTTWTPTPPTTTWRIQISRLLERCSFQNHWANDREVKRNYDPILNCHRGRALLHWAQARVKDHLLASLQPQDEAWLRHTKRRLAPNSPEVQGANHSNLQKRVREDRPSCVQEQRRPAGLQARGNRSIFLLLLDP